MGGELRLKHRGHTARRLLRHGFAAFRRHRFAPHQPVRINPAGTHRRSEGGKGDRLQQGGLPQPVVAQQQIHVLRLRRGKAELSEILIRMDEVDPALPERPEIRE